MSALTPTTSVSPNLQHLEATLGVFYIGYVVSMIGYGFTFFQTYVYYARFPNDHWTVRLTVALACGIDTATSGLSSQALYYYLVDLFPFTIGLENATKTFCVENTLSIVVIYIVQMFYVSRVFNLSKNALVAGPIALISTIGLVLGIIMSNDLFHNNAFSHLADSGPKAIVAACQAMYFLSALLIFSSMCFYLKSPLTSSPVSLDDRFNSFVRYVVIRGGAATFIQFLYFITFVSMPDKQIWIPFHLVVSKLFVNSLIAMLNAREIFRGQGINEEESMPTSQRKTGGTFSSSGVRSNPTGVRFNVADNKPIINIEVSRTVEQDHDKPFGSYEDEQSIHEESAQKQMGLGV